MSSPRNVFLQLWIILSLYVSTTAFLVLVFQFINYLYPDVTDPYAFSKDSVRWATAMLIAFFPAHLIALGMLQRDQQTEPALRNNRLRQWLLYFTLFLAAFIIVCDIYTLIYYFLSGDITESFILKVLALGLVAAGIFWYYLNDLRRSDASLSNSMRWLLGVAIAAVTTAVVGSFYLSGSPFAARDHRIDEKRISDLQNIQGHIVSFWQDKKRLPKNLDELTNDISGFAAPKDPVSGEAYGYEIKGPEAFTLCATFNRASEENLPSLSGIYNLSSSENWKHGAGKVCFERTIDPERNKKREKDRM